MRSAITQGIDAAPRRLHVLVSRRGLAMVPARVAMRGRHAAELTHQLRTAMTTLFARREREFRTLRLRLEACDLRRRLAGIRARLESADRRVQVAVRRTTRSCARAARGVGRASRFVRAPSLFSGVVMPSAGMRTVRRSFAAPRPSSRAIGSRGTCTKANWSVRQ